MRLLRRLRRKKKIRMVGPITIIREHSKVAMSSTFIAPPKYRVQEINSLSEVDDPLNTSHPAIAAPVRDLARRLAVERNGRLDVEETIISMLRWVTENIEYDNVHASASQMWRYNMNLTYLTAKEALELGRGICGEQSLVLLSLLRHVGIPAVLARPHVSHIAVLAQNPYTGEYYLVDTVAKQVTIMPAVDALKRFVSPSGKYVVGPISLDEFTRQTLRRRRAIGRQIGIRDPREAMDIEYALFCIEDLPYGTPKARRLLEYLKQVGYCHRTFKGTPEDMMCATFLLSHIVKMCGKIPLRSLLARRAPRFVGCVRRMWDNAWKLLSRFRELLRKGEIEWIG